MNLFKLDFTSDLLNLKWNVLIRVVVLVLETKIFEALIKLRQLTSRINQTVRSTSPCRMAVRINIQLNFFPWTSQSRSRGKGTTICHFDRNFMIIRMNIFFQCTAPTYLAD